VRVETRILPERYRDPVPIGHGAMGDIYRARDSLLDRDVAVKVLAERYAGDEEIRARFTREALAAARLSAEPGIVTVFDVGEWGGRPFLVMAYLPGGSLDERLRAGVPPVEQSVAWLEDAAHALDAGHARGIVHRDVKPANLLLDENGRVHVADFGIASAAGLQSLTLTGTMLGTAGYLAPEQARGERATPASDRYALAAVGWELLTGRRVFASDSPTAEAAAHAHSPPPPLCEARHDLPCRELDEVFARALAKEPAERPDSCAALVWELRRALAGDAATRVLVPPARRRLPVRWLVLAALLLGALVTGAALAAALGGGDSAAPVTSTRVTTVTRPGTTVTRPATTVTASPPPAANGPALTNEATALLRAGRYEEAMAKAQEALASLGGTGQLYEAYALYDLGAALANLGECKDAKKALEESKKIQGQRSEIDAAKALCEGKKGKGGD
jgi:tetratricopeptide (TPR) repeat protein/tRNA A-37 threonylcarbamoyl transferase component Bud32